MRLIRRIINLTKSRHESEIEMYFATVGLLSQIIGECFLHQFDKTGQFGGMGCIRLIEPVVFG